jgi:hypothetical protein
MLIGAALLAGGAVINAIGIQPQIAAPPAEVVSAHPHWKRVCVFCHVERRNSAAASDTSSAAAQPP